MHGIFRQKLQSMQKDVKMQNKNSTIWINNKNTIYNSMKKKTSDKKIYRLSKIFSLTQWGVYNRPSIRRIPIKLVIVKNSNGSRSIQAEYLQASGRDNIQMQLKRYGKGDAVAGQKLLDNALPSLETISSDFTDMLIQIEKFPSNSIKLSSAGAWKVGGIIEEFNKKYSKHICFPTIFNVLAEWFVGRIGVQYGKKGGSSSQTYRTYWKQVYIFHKVFDFEDISNPNIKWFFEDTLLLGQSIWFRVFSAMNIHKKLAKEYSSINGYNGTEWNFAPYCKNLIDECKEKEWFDKKLEIIKLIQTPGIKRNKSKTWFYESGGPYVICPDES